MKAIVSAYSFVPDGVVATVILPDTAPFNVPITLDWANPNLRSTVCAVVRMNCVAQGFAEVDGVVLPDLYTE